MHFSVLKWTQKVIDDYGLAPLSTLECGSIDMNGSVRQFFTGPYWGIDMSAGRGVDQRANVESLPFDDGAYECVISTEMLEHCARPWVAIKEMARVSSRFVVFTARGFDDRGVYSRHLAPNDYNRFSLDGVQVMVDDAGLVTDELILDPEACGYFYIGRVR